MVFGISTKCKKKENQKKINFFFFIKKTLLLIRHSKIIDKKLTAHEIATADLDDDKFITKAEVRRKKKKCDFFNFQN